MQVKIIVPRASVHEVEPVLKHCCETSGDWLLGRREEPDSGEVLFLVQLMQDANRNAYSPVLQPALHWNTITSFRWTHGSIVELTAPRMIELIQDFPLAVGETWTPALNHPHRVYLSLHKQLMSAAQAAWVLVHQEIAWRYL